MKHNSFFLLLVTAVFFLLASCNSSEQPPTDDEFTKPLVELTVWGAEEDEFLLEEIFTSFQNHYADQAEFRITHRANPTARMLCWRIWSIVRMYLLLLTTK